MKHLKKNTLKIYPWIFRVLIQDKTFESTAALCSTKIARPSMNGSGTVLLARISDRFWTDLRVENDRFPSHISVAKFFVTFFREEYLAYSI